MKKFPRVLAIMCCVLLLATGLVQANSLSFEVQSATVVDSVDTDFTAMNSRGVVVEVKVINTGDEVKIWPSDFSLGINDGTQDVRIAGFLLTNAVSDPEDEMNFRYFQGTSIRKGTRYMKVFFVEMMNWELAGVFQNGEFDEAVLYFATPASAKFTVTWEVETYEGEY